MKRLRQKLKNSRGLTLVEMIAAVGVLALLGLMLNTGLSMAQDSYNKMTGEAESQLLLSTLTDLLSNELRYHRRLPHPWICRLRTEQQHHQASDRSADAGGLFHFDVPLYQHQK